MRSDRFGGFVALSLLVAAVGCGGSGSSAGTGGAPGTASGGSNGTGGVSATGGASATGGTTATGGASASGGTTATGGASATGGTTATGGTAATGGTTPTGGAAGGANGSGGLAGGGGAGATGGNGGGQVGTGGAAGSGAGGAGTTMSFFVTSRGPGNGGNLAGLDGADAFCKMLATAVSADLGAKTWHAYLSTAAVNAKDRIGTGPWRNAAGVIIANNLTDLHDQIAANAALNATWPPMSTAIALDEHGAPVPTTPLVHDILTGSNTDGTVMTGATCKDWTSQSTADTAEVGHSNRAGGGRPPSWNAAHTVGCGPFTSNNQTGTVSSGGGRGSIYCFAVPQ